MAFSGHKARLRRQSLRNWIILLSLLFLLAVSIGSWRTYQVYQSELPSFEQLHNIEPSLKTKVYDRNGILLKEFYSENRILTPFSNMPEDLVKMLIATEDRAFRQHWGIDLRRIMIVATSNLVKWRVSAGASTVTQQLARMLFLNRQVTLERKIKEALTAIKLERTYSKNEILEMYFNQYYFSRGAYGVAAASRLFFSKTPIQLDLNDCAILVGMLKAPNINSPLNNPEKSLKARNRVLYSYYKWGGINKHQYDSLKSEPLEITPPEEQVGTAPYFTETVRKYVLDRYGEKALYSGGLRIFTSLDATLQKAADAAIAKK
ncbi:MAG: transglycosylase domain-containing protein, partial [Candidatus Zixiibacteriota bacterium]